MAESRFNPPLVVLVHGIRTHGNWQKRVGAILSCNSIPFEAYDYGFYRLARFLAPGLNRRMVDKFYEHYRNLVHSNPGLQQDTYAQRPSMVGHSFGTYIVAECMLQHPEVKVDKFLLCGSILPLNFDWETLFKRDQVHLVRNECGAKDFWTRMVGRVVRRTGSSGYEGFGLTRAGFEEQRFDYFRHSDYFLGTHVEAHWLPFLRKGSMDLFVRHGRVYRFSGPTGEDGIRKQEYEKLLDRTHYEIDNPNYDSDPNYQLHKLPRGRSITWVSKEPDIYTLLMDGHGNPRGYVDALPVTDEAYELIKADRLPDPDIRPEHIRGYERGAAVKIYLMSIGIAPDVRRLSKGLYKEAFHQLIDAFLDKLIYYARVEGVRVSQLLAVTWTTEGQKLCKALQMDQVGVDALNHPMFELSIDGRELSRAERKFRKLKDMRLLYGRMRSATAGRGSAEQ